MKLAEHSKLLEDDHDKFFDMQFEFARKGDIVNEVTSLAVVWDKWGFNPVKKEFVFFTLWFLDENDNRIYKPKCWVPGTLKDFLAVIRNDTAILKNFTLHTDWF